MTQLAHFSEDPDIAEFRPRPVKVTVQRPPGQEWLNGSLVWAIDEAHEMLYLFPRECPRILLWPTAETTEEDRARWFPDSSLRAVAYIERAWLSRLRQTPIYRYELPIDSFEAVGEIGMWVSRTTVTPTTLDQLTDLPARLEERAVGLRTLDDLTPLKNVWESSLHASGIRLRNASGWGDPGWPHSRGKSLAT